MCGGACIDDNNKVNKHARLSCMPRNFVELYFFCLRGGKRDKRHYPDIHSLFLFFGKETARRTDWRCFFLSWCTEVTPPSKAYKTIACITPPKKQRTGFFFPSLRSLHTTCAPSCVHSLRLSPFLHRNRLFPSLLFICFTFTLHMKFTTIILVAIGVAVTLAAPMLSPTTKGDKAVIGYFEPLHGFPIDQFDFSKYTHIN